MTEINKFEMYQMQYGICNLIDEVDKYVNELKKIDNYLEVQKFLDKKFEKVEGGKKLINYPKLNKQFYIIVKSDAIEVFAGKNKEPYFSKGWRKPQD